MECSTIKIGTLGDGNLGVRPWEPLWEPTLIATGFRVALNSKSKCYPNKNKKETIKGENFRVEKKTIKVRIMATSGEPIVDHLNLTIEEEEEEEEPSVDQLKQ